jgi:membrane protein
MTYFDGDRRDLRKPIRGNILNSAKSLASPVSRVLPSKQNPHKFRSVEIRRIRGGSPSRAKHRKSQRTLLFWGIELLVAVSLNLVRRLVNDWTASLAKADTAHQRKVFDPSISREAYSTLIDPPTHRRQKAEGEKTHATRSYAARVLDLLKNTVSEWSRDRCPQLGAALAYYTIFSLAPLVLVLLGVFGFIYGGSEQAREKILEQLRHLMDPSGVKVIQDIANNAAEPKASILATAIGILIALVGASGIFGQLQDALNTIWSVKPKPSQAIWVFARARFLSFAMVGGVCFLILMSLTVEGLVKGCDNYLRNIVPGGHYLGLTVFYVFDLAIIVLLFAMLFRYLPDAKIAWRDVWTGAVLTAILFVIGKLLLGLYLGSGAAGSAYGAASSLVTLLLWIFYSAQILLFGAEFTKVYANTYGSHIEPEVHAVKVERKEIELPDKESHPIPK